MDTTPTTRVKDRYKSGIDKVITKRTSENQKNGVRLKCLSLNEVILKRNKF
jgi:hypothetical protein